MDIDFFDIDPLDNKLIGEKIGDLVLARVAETNELLKQARTVFLITVQPLVELLAANDPTTDQNFLFFWARKITEITY